MCLYFLFVYTVGLCDLLVFPEDELFTEEEVSGMSRIVSEAS